MAFTRIYCALTLVRAQGNLWTVKKLQGKLRGKNRVQQSLELGLFFFHRPVVEYGQIRELPVAENVQAWLGLNIKYFYSTCYLASFTDTPFKNILCFLAGIRRGQQQLLQQQGSLCTKNMSGSVLYQAWGYSKMQNLSTETELLFFLSSCTLLFLFMALYNVSLVTRGLSDIFLNKTQAVVADLIINWRSQ